MELGGLRFVLALLVAIDHLTGVSATDHLGRCAVFGFYVVSGFLITRVLNVGYEFDWRRFWTNRFLRLIPAYYVVALGTFVALFLFPTEAARYHGAWTAHGGVVEYINQLTVVPLAFNHGPFRIVPPMWSVAVEIINYALLWVFVARSPLFAWMALVFGAGYHLAAAGFDLDYYAPFYAAIFPFACGALIHFAAPVAAVRYRSKFLLLFVMHLAMMPLLTGDMRILIYGSMVLVTVVVASMAQLPDSKANKALGELAYPIFLIHWLVGFVISLMMPGLTRGWPLLLLSIGPIIAMSWLVAHGSNRIIEPLRIRVRLSQRRAAPARWTLPLSYPSSEGRTDMLSHHKATALLRKIFDQRSGEDSRMLRLNIRVRR